MSSRIQHPSEPPPEQHNLGFVGKEPHVEELSKELIRSIRSRSTFLAAWNFAQDFAGLEDKQCYQPLGIDSSHWSKIRKGLASPPADERFVRYMDIVRNEIPLVWLVESRGYNWTTLLPHRSAHERRIAELESENRDLKRAMALWADASKGKA